MKTAFYSIHRFESDFLLQAADFHELVMIDRALSVDTVHLAQGCQAVCIFVNDDASAPVIAKLADLGVRFLTLRSSGYNNVDLKEAVKRGIRVAHVSDYSPFSVAEHAVGLMLALNRHLVEANARIRNHDFSIEGLMGFDMYGKTVGIIGTGRTGSQAAHILHGFGCAVLAVDPVENVDLKKYANLRYTTLDILLQLSDIVTLHAPLSASTKHLIDSRRISQMKQGVMLINTGRGDLMCTADVLSGLESGQIGYLGMDVYEKENGLFFEDHSREILRDKMFLRLLGFKNVLITSHQGFLTDSALRRIAEDTMANLECFENGTYTKNILTP